jgi:hypothetical protein
MGLSYNFSIHCVCPARLVRAEHLAAPGRRGRDLERAADVPVHGSAFTFSTVFLSSFFPGQLAAVMDEEAGRAREFVLLDRHDVDQKFFVREIRARQFEGFREFCLVNGCAPSVGGPSGFSSSSGSAASFSLADRGAS